LAAISFEHADEARAALGAIVSDPAHGADALSDAQTLSSLLQDLLPDAPREAGLLIAAASAGLPSALREHVAHGMDVGTAIRLTASSFAARTAFTAAACAWVVGELAVALGLATHGVAAAALASAEAGGGQAGGGTPGQALMSSGTTVPGAGQPPPGDAAFPGARPVVTPVAPAPVIGQAASASQATVIPARRSRVALVMFAVIGMAVAVGGIAYGAFWLASDHHSPSAPRLGTGRQSGSPSSVVSSSASTCPVARAPAPALTVTPASGPITSTLKVTGVGLVSNGIVELYFHDSIMGARIRTDCAGRFQVFRTIPDQGFYHHFIGQPFSLSVVEYDSSGTYVGNGGPATAQFTPTS
jgi:hypothetical protein